jgi:HD-GYP domain-containing protein (c-di-GMP phosphodiesterase class II)
MRRITTKYAKSGMILGIPVYDSRGMEILCRNTTLTDQSLAKMANNRVTEIFIEDPRTDDIIVAPMVSPEKEGKFINAFHQFVSDALCTPGLGRENIQKLSYAVSWIVRDLGLSILGEINVSCFISEEDYIYVKPAKAAILAMAFGQRLGMSPEELPILGMASLLKDISYIYLCPEAISSPEIMEEDTKAAKGHPIESYNLLVQSCAVNEEIAKAVLQHHEYWSGAGFPKGLKAEQISNYAQTIAISDAFFDLLVALPGKQKYMSHEAIEYIMANSGDQFSPNLVELFVRKIPAYPTGLMVKLNTGETGIVSDSNLGFIARPVVRVFYDPERGTLAKPYHINLAKSEFQSKLISQIMEYD